MAGPPSVPPSSSAMVRERTSSSDECHRSGGGGRRPGGAGGDKGGRVRAPEGPWERRRASSVVLVPPRAAVEGDACREVRRGDVDYEDDVVRLRHELLVEVRNDEVVDADHADGEGCESVVV
jgi:hypothetical protein